MPFDATPILTTPTITVSPPAKKPPPVPKVVFSARASRHWDRLDFRPVIWSLYNRPEEWEISGTGLVIAHTKSRHRFWIGAGRAHLYEARCSCHSSVSRANIPILRDRIAFRLAARAWRAWAAAGRHPGEKQPTPRFVFTGPARSVTNVQFAGHFLPTT